MLGCMSALPASRGPEGGSHFIQERVGQGEYERTRSREPGSLLRPYSINRELAQVALSIQHIALRSTEAIIAIQTSVETALEIENAARDTLIESARPMQPSLQERVEFAVEYVDMLHDKLQITEAQRQAALSLTPAQQDAVDGILQIIQVEQPTAGFLNTRNVPSALVGVIKRFLDNPPSDEMLEITQAMFGEGLIFLAHGLSDQRIRELLLTPDGQPTTYAREVAYLRSSHDSFILEFSPDGASVFKKMTKSGLDTTNWDRHYPTHDWIRFTLPLPEEGAETLPANVKQLRR